MKMKTALTIAGSDCSGGAGIQADIKTMTMNGVYAMSAITALTAQNTTGVRAIQESTPDFLKQQIDAVFEDIFPDSVKIGMVSSSDNNFFLQFDNTTHEKYDDEYHLTTLKRGEYCKFCKGTYARATRGLADHNFTEQVDGQVANNRFYIAETCDDCGYETSEYVTAKAVVSSYYGVEDGEAHTLTVSDLSDSGVKTSIRYGTDADNCNKTSAPNYTQAGYYTVYYKINYTYSGETMTENGVSYVHILADESDEGGSNTIIVVPPAHEHDFRYLETIPASCENLGYERWQCDGCGELQKMNYSPAKGHNYEDIILVNVATPTQAIIPIRQNTIIINRLQSLLVKNTAMLYMSAPIAEPPILEIIQKTKSISTKKL